MRVGSLFSGIGGFDLGLERAGHEVVWQVEFNAQCQCILRRHWPEARLHKDVCSVGRSVLEPVDLICGGFPCQDLSVAGKRAGLAGKRSGLFYELMRIVDELSPRWVLIENVPGLLSSNEGRDMGAVIGTLGELGYWWAYRSLDAQYLGVAQRRERVFVLAERGSGARRCAEILLEPESVWRDSPPRREAGAGVARSLTSSTGGCSGKEQQHTFIGRDGALNALASTGDVSHCLNAGGMGRQDYETETLIAHTLRAEGYDASEDGTGRGTPIVPVAFHSRQDPIHDPECSLPLEAKAGQCVAFQTRIARNGRGQPKDICDALTSSEGGTHADSKPHVAGTFGVRRLTPTECEALQAFPRDWTAWGINEDGERVEMKDGPRYRMLGNAVCVNVAEWIGERLSRGPG